MQRNSLRIFHRAVAQDAGRGGIGLMTQGFGAIVVIAALWGTPAPAADMALKAPPAPIYSWAGCYVGGNFGGGWGAPTGGLSGFTPDFTPTVTTGNNVPADLNVRPAGVLGGGQVGCNWQSGLWVWGGEADFQGSDIQNFNTIGLPGVAVPFFAPSTSTASEDLRWFGTVRARVGAVVAPQWLVYATGGFAYGSVSDSATLFFTPATAGTFAGSQLATRGGWTVGGGAEYAVYRSLSVKAEYLFVDLGTTTVTEFDPVHFPTSSISYNFAHRDSIFRVGLNWRFANGNPFAIGTK